MLAWSWRHIDSKATGLLPQEVIPELALLSNSEFDLPSKFVFVCFDCNLFILGEACIRHHTLCCLNSEFHRVEPPPAFNAPPHWLWANCYLCCKQELFFKCCNAAPKAKTSLHWARITGKLFVSFTNLSAWKCCAHRPELCIPLPTSVLEFLRL
jgi:hypothetical protein